MSAAQKLGVSPPGRAEHKLFRACGPVVTLWVESPADERFWRAFLHPRCRLHFPEGGGRERVLRELERARGDAELIFLAILDADYDRAEGTLPSDERVFWTDGVDLEATLLARPELLDRLLARTVGPAWAADAAARWGQPFGARLFAFVRPAGRLRWYKHRNREDGALRLLKFSKKADQGREIPRFDRWDRCGADTLTPDDRGLLRELIAFNNAQNLTGEVDRLLVGLRDLPDANDARICNGHDLVGALCAWLQAQKSGRKRKAPPGPRSAPPSADAPSAATWKLPCNPEELGQRLGDCCDEAHLHSTDLWQQLRRWQQANPTQPLLREQDAEAI